MTLQRLLPVAGLALAASLFLLGTAVVFRTHVAEYVIETSLLRAGLSDVSLTVSKMDTSGLNVHDLTAENGALQIARIGADFSVSNLLRGRIDALTVEEMNAAVIWDNNGLRLGGFRPRPDREPLKIPYIGRLRADGMTFTVTTPTTTLRAPFNLSAEATENGWNTVAAGSIEGPGVSVAVDWTGLITPEDLARSSGRGRFEIAVEAFAPPGSSARINATGLVNLRAADGSFEIAVGRPLVFSSSGAAQSAGPSLLYGLETLPWSLTINPSKSTAAMLLTVEGDHHAVRFDVAASGRAGAGSLNVVMAGEASRDPQGSEFRLATGRAEVQRLPIGGGEISGHIDISNLAGSPDAAQGPIDAAMDVSGVSVADITLDRAQARLAGVMKIADGTATFGLDALRIALMRAAYGGWTLAAPAEFTLANTGPGQQTVAIDAPKSSIAANLALALPELSLRGANTDDYLVIQAPAIRVTASTGGIGLNGSIDAANISARHPLGELRIGRVKVAAEAGELSGNADAELVRIGALAEGRSPAGALVTSATLATKGDDYEIRGTLSTARGARLGPYSVRAARDFSRGAATIAIPKAKFERGGKFDATDLAFIAPVSDLSGTFGLEAKRTWTGPRIADAAVATLENVSFTMGDVIVAELTTALELVALSPPRSEKPQRIAARSITAGLPLSALTAEYTLAGDGTLAIKEASAGVAGGQISLADAIVPIDGRDGMFTLGVRKIDMGELAAQANVDGLSVTGTLTGAIPLRSDKSGLHFAQGVLRADAPGRLVYKPASPSPGLSQNQGGALLLEVLSNFAYDRLSVTVDGPVTQDISLAVALAGKNPDLYGGYPIEFNLNLSGRLTQILRQGLAVYGIPADLERQLREGKPAGP